jgi:hypothetical protein
MVWIGGTSLAHEKLFIHEYVHRSLSFVVVLAYYYIDDGVPTTQWQLCLGGSLKQ